MQQKTLKMAVSVHIGIVIDISQFHIIIISVYIWSCDPSSASTFLWGVSCKIVMKSQL